MANVAQQKHRTAAVTGAGSGLGRDIALALAAKNYQVFGTALSHWEIDDLAAFQIRLQRPVKAGGNVSGRIDLLAEVSHHVGTGKAEYAMPHQQRHQPSEKAGLSEHHVGSPRGLVAGPVIIGLVVLEEAFVQRIQLSAKAVQQIGPVDLQLLLHQFLRLCVVLDPDKAVALLTVLQSFPVHLTGQPLPSIQTDRNVERKTGLDARIHPSHWRMDLVLVDDLARFQPAHYVRAPMFEGRAEFHTAEGAYQSALDLSLGGDRARDLLLVRPGVDVV